MSGREFCYHLSRVPFRIWCALYWLSRRPVWLWGMAERLYWKFMFRFVLPTVWVQPNMRTGMVEYIECLRKFYSCKKKEEKQVEAELSTCARLTSQEVRLVLDYVLAGCLPYPTVEEAIRALPRVGGTIRCGVGMQYLLKPIVFPPKAIQLIGGQFCVMGETGLEMSSSGRISIIGCVFRGGGPGPRDWSPRGEILEGGSFSEAIRVNL